MKKMFPVFALGALMMFVASCEKDTEFENKEEPGTENADTFLGVAPVAFITGPNECVI